MVGIVYSYWDEVSSERIRIVSLYMYSAASDVYSRLHSVSASCSHSDRLILRDDQTNKRQHADRAVISEGHKEFVNVRTAGAASCSADNAIRIRILIRPNSLKPLVGTPLIFSR